MNITTYQTISGLTVATSKQTLTTAMINRTQRILEDLLGFTLSGDDYNNNEYAESGKTTAELPPISDTVATSAADAVTFAYRLFPFNSKDAFLSIDPCTAVHKVKLIKDTVTYKTFDADEYRLQYDRGLIRYLERVGTSWDFIYNYVYNYNFDYSYSEQPIEDQFQLAVDATWVWADGAIPDDLNDVWADMVTYYSDVKRRDGIKSETLGSHSYAKFDNKPPQFQDYNRSIIAKYAGPHGSIKTTAIL